MGRPATILIGTSWITFDFRGSSGIGRAPNLTKRKRKRSWVRYFTYILYGGSVVIIGRLKGEQRPERLRCYFRKTFLNTERIVIDDGRIWKIPTYESVKGNVDTNGPSKARTIFATKDRRRDPRTLFLVIIDRGRRKHYFIHARLGRT